MLYRCMRVPTSPHPIQTWEDAAHVMPDGHIGDNDPPPPAGIDLPPSPCIDLTSLGMNRHSRRPTPGTDLGGPRPHNAGHWPHRRQ
jgi:hypothetical protein